MTDDLKVSLDCFEVVETLGKGSLGEVFLIKQKQTEKLFVAKSIKYSITSSTKEQQLFNQELIAYSKVEHKAILPLYGFSMTNFEKQNYPVIITEYMPNDSLSNIFKQINELSPSNKYIILLGIAEGMNYLQSLGFIHRKLKPTNILIDSDFYPHICDFEESKISDIFDSSDNHSIYTAPEITSDNLYTSASDVYSFSLIAYELIIGKEIQQNHKSSNETNLLNLSLISDEYIRSFLTRCNSSDPDKRPTFKEILVEIKQDRFKKFMNVTNDSEVEKYIRSFNNGLPPLHPPQQNKLGNKSPRRKPPVVNAEIEKLKKNADNGNALSMRKYAKLLKKGEKVPVNKQKAAYYFKKAADLGDVYSMKKICFNV